MAGKNTAQLENELREADDLKKFDKENAENFYFTLAEYLNHLLAEKNLTRQNILSLAIARQVRLIFKRLLMKNINHVFFYFPIIGGVKFLSTIKRLIASIT